MLGWKEKPKCTTEEYATSQNGCQGKTQLLNRVYLQQAELLVPGTWGWLCCFTGTLTPLESCGISPSLANNFEGFLCTGKSLSRWFFLLAACFREGPALGCRKAGSPVAPAGVGCCALLALALCAPRRGLGHRTSCHLSRAGLAAAPCTPLCPSPGHGMCWQPHSSRLTWAAVWLHGSGTVLL